MKGLAIPQFSDRAHRIAFRSRHCRRDGAAVGPIHDLLYNDILIWLLPTHPWTLQIKFVTVLTLLVSLLVWTTRYQLRRDNALNAAAAAAAMSVGTLIGLWFYYYRRVIQIVWDQCEWMDPTVTDRHRLAMHTSALRWYESEPSARRGACVSRLPALASSVLPTVKSTNTTTATTTSTTATRTDQNKAVNDISHPYTTNVWLLDDLPWQFCFQPTVQDGLAVIKRNKANESKYIWKPIPVPSNWTLQEGYDKPIYTNIKYPWPCQPPLVPHLNSTGVYRVELVLPWLDSDDATTTSTTLLDNYTLLFHGVESAFYVYWNEHLVGFSKDSRLPAEFDVTSYIQQRRSSSRSNTVHTLQVVVMRWSDASYVEDQDQWWMAGIHRSVELIRRPYGADIVDFQVQADANGHINCHVECRQRRSQQPPQRIIVHLYDDEQLSADGDEWKAGQCMWTATREIDYDGSDSVGTLIAVNVSGDVDGVRLWSAEIPNLYTLTVTLESCRSGAASMNTKDSTYTVQQVESCRVGFRTVDIYDGMVHVNGKRITVCGMNRHEHDPDHGKTISLESMKRDICLLKQNNFNMVRTSHYPNHPSFYRFTDYYGLYVWDEANVETHGMKPMGRLAHDFGWERAFISRIIRMVQRDRNHASIIFWSLGNEAGRGRNLTKARQLVQVLDPSRPVIYESGGAVAEGTGRTELTDVISTMYPSVPRTIRLASRPDEDRPVILCEYSHSMGNSNGNLHYYWQAFWDDKLPRLQGGCIWDFVDQGIRVPDTKRGSGFYFAYGGDFDDTCNDAQFCCNGMFSPDRQPHPVVSEIKFLQQPVQLVPVPECADGDPIILDSDGKLTFVVRNRYSFRDLSHIAWSWALTSNSSIEIMRSGRFDIPTQENGTTVIQLDDAIMSVRAHPGNAYFLLVRGVLREACSWADAGHTVVSFQFPVSFPTTSIVDKVSIPVTAEAFAMLDVKEDEKNIHIFQVRNGVRNELAAVDKGTGALVSYAPHGKNVLLAEGITPNFVRAATDNDRGGLELALNFMLVPAWVQAMYYTVFGYHDCSYWSRWKSVGLDGSTHPYIDSTTYAIDITTNLVEIIVFRTIRSRYKGVKLIDVATHYCCYKDGRIQIRNDVKPLKVLHRIASLPRIGIRLVLDPLLYHIQYFGRGPEENYPDRKSASEKGVYETTPATMAYTDYVFPVENGSRSDCEYIAFRSNKDGEGVCFVSAELDQTIQDSESKFSCSAQLHSISELHHAMHACDLEHRSNGLHPIHVSIDHALMGLGGDCSWYPVVYDEFLVKPNRSYGFSLWLLPLKGGDDAGVQARTAPSID